MKKLWIDIINPSHALFFNALLSELDDYKINITIRDRAETVDLVESFGIKGKIIGTDYRDPLKKSVNMIFRTLDLAMRTPNFDAALSFENGMNVLVSKIRRKTSILYCDNDLKFFQKNGFFQNSETKIKTLASYTIVPEACYENFKRVISEDKLIRFNGYKEDIYIADHEPDSKFLDKLPFNEFVVIRPEALGSFYVKEMQSIVPELLRLFTREGVNVVYLPREVEDVKYAKGFDVFIPEKALNGLDLCHYADAFLTGSGTMAREAACMGVTAVSFFPSKTLLSVDQQLVDEGKIFHSRNVEAIIDHVLFQHKTNKNRDLERCREVKRNVVRTTKQILQEMEEN